MHSHEASRRAPGEAAGLAPDPESRPWRGRTGVPSRCALLAALLTLALVACGGGGDGGPRLPDACAYVDEVDAPFPLALPGGFSSYTIVSSPTKGSLETRNRLTGEFVYTPNPALRGSGRPLEDRFQFQAHGPDGSTNIATFRLVYTPRIMPLGDSITWGGSGTASDSEKLRFVGYRLPLRAALLARGFQLDYVGTLASGIGTPLADDPQHEGHGGWSADQLVFGPPPFPDTGTGTLSDWLEQTRPDVILLHIGTNDLNSGGDPAAEAQDVRPILETINDWEADNWPVQVLVARIIINHTQAPANTILF